MTQDQRVALCGKQTEQNLGLPVVLGPGCTWGCPAAGDGALHIRRCDLAPS